jgi:hypothetical protein
LEERACACYATIQSEFARLLPGGVEPATDGQR